MSSEHRVNFPVRADLDANVDAPQLRRIESDLDTLREHIMGNYQEVDQPLMEGLRRLEGSTSRMGSLVEALHGPEE